MSATRRSISSLLPSEALRPPFTLNYCTITDTTVNVPGSGGIQMLFDVSTRASHRIMTQDADFAQ